LGVKITRRVITDVLDLLQPENKLLNRILLQYYYNRILQRTANKQHYTSYCCCFCSLDQELILLLFFLLLLGQPLQRKPKAVLFQIGLGWNLAGIFFK